MNTNKVTKTAMIWISILYTVCVILVLIIPAMMQSASSAIFHGMSSDVLSVSITIGSFIYGLIVWNIITVASVWLFGTIYNKVK